MVDKNRKTFILNEKNKDFFENFIGTAGSKKIMEVGNEILKSFNSMISFSKIELARLFTEDESLLIVEASRENKYNCDVSAKYFLKDMLNRYNLFTANDISEEVLQSLLRKIEGLAEFQCYTLLIMAFEYINAGENKDISRFFFCKKAD